MTTRKKGQPEPKGNCPSGGILSLHASIYWLNVLIDCFVVPPRNDVKGAFETAPFYFIDLTRISQAFVPSLKSKSIMLKFSINP